MEKTRDLIKNEQKDVNKIIYNIKSEYIIKILFFHLNEKIKLKLIKYNKNLQNTIDINLNNYKFFSKRYIEFEADGKGKEYYGYNDELKFEGEYLNGKRNGKGKEYNSEEQLIFEGEFTNGKKWNGKIKEYDDYYDRLIIEVEYVNGKRNGKGKEYYNNGRIKFEGEYLNGKRNGKGKEY